MLFGTRCARAEKDGSFEGDWNVERPPRRPPGPVLPGSLRPAAGPGSRRVLPPAVSAAASSGSSVRGEAEGGEEALRGGRRGDEAGHGRVPRARGAFRRALRRRPRVVRDGEGDERRREHLA